MNPTNTVEYRGSQNSEIISMPTPPKHIADRDRQADGILAKDPEERRVDAKSGRLKLAEAVSDFFSKEAATAAVKAMLKGVTSAASKADKLKLQAHKAGREAARLGGTKTIRGSSKVYEGQQKARNARAVSGTSTKADRRATARDRDLRNDLKDQSRRNKGQPPHQRQKMTAEEIETRRQRQSQKDRLKSMVSRSKSETAKKPVGPMTRSESSQFFEKKPSKPATSSSAPKSEAPKAPDKQVGSNRATPSAARRRASQKNTRQAGGTPEAKAQKGAPKDTGSVDSMAAKRQAETKTTTQKPKQTQSAQGQGGAEQSTGPQAKTFTGKDGKPIQGRGQNIAIDQSTGKLLYPDGKGGWRFPQPGAETDFVNQQWGELNNKHRHQIGVQLGVRQDTLGNKLKANAADMFGGNNFASQMLTSTVGMGVANAGMSMIPAGTDEYGNRQTLADTTVGQLATPVLGIMGASAAPGAVANMTRHRAGSLSNISAKAMSQPTTQAASSAAAGRAWNQAKDTVNNAKQTVQGAGAGNKPADGTAGTKVASLGQLAAGIWA